jgi:hypothetical protein
MLLESALSSLIFRIVGYSEVVGRLTSRQSGLVIFLGFRKVWTDPQIRHSRKAHCAGKGTAGGKETTGSISEGIPPHSSGAAEELFQHFGAVTTAWVSSGCVSWRRLAGPDTTVT